MSYQVAILGGGPAGYVSAIKAAQLGLKVVVVEKWKNLGGTCLQIGCIPSKALLASSEHYHFAKHGMAAHGIAVGDVSIDVSTMLKRKDLVILKLSKGIEFLFKKHGIDRKFGFASFINPTTIEIDHEGQREQITAEKIVICTGSVPIELPFMPFDGKRIVNSEQALSFAQIPKSLLVIGAGAIGLELGSVWSRLGTEVTVVEFLPRIAPGFDLEISKTLQKSLEKQGLKIHLNTKVQSAQVTDNGVSVTALKDNIETKFDAEIVLVGVGRKPFYEGLNLENAGVKLTEKNRIATNGHFQTSTPNIYAIGDVIDGPMLAHKAEEEGVAVAEILAGKPGHVNYEVIPGVIYTAPEGASVGLTEEAAKEAGKEIRVGKFNFQANGRALAADTAEGFVKVIADAKTDRVLGVHILASNASELISEAVVLMEFSGSAEDLARTVHAHPTMSEAIKNAAEAAWDGK